MHSLPACPRAPERLVPGPELRRLSEEREQVRVEFGELSRNVGPQRMGFLAGGLNGFVDAA
jgi:hypothetical protein